MTKLEKLLSAVEAMKAAFPPPRTRSDYAEQAALFDLYEAANALSIQPAAPVMGFFDPNKKYTNHLSVLIDAVGHDNMLKVKTALNIAGYTIYFGNPDAAQPAAPVGGLGVHGIFRIITNTLHQRGKTLLADDSWAIANALYDAALSTNPGEQE